MSAAVYPAMCPASDMNQCSSLPRRNVSGVRHGCMCGSVCWCPVEFDFVCRSILRYFRDTSGILPGYFRDTSGINLRQFGRALSIIMSRASRNATVADTAGYRSPFPGFNGPFPGYRSSFQGFNGPFPGYRRARNVGGPQGIN